ncbi:MAG: hypothetical protein K0R47_453 [Brevibacillus sp.]|nr:hypothetical protein [Brevibacillus sp.]
MSVFAFLLLKRRRYLSKIRAKRTDPEPPGSSYKQKWIEIQIIPEPLSILVFLINHDASFSHADLVTPVLVPFASVFW